MGQNGTLVPSSCRGGRGGRRAGGRMRMTAHVDHGWRGDGSLHAHCPSLDAQQREAEPPVSQCVVRPSLQ